MSIIFTSDWHWDSSLFGQSRNGEILAGIRQVIETAKRKNCKNIFVAGDIMDSPRYKGPEALSGFAAMINNLFIELPDLHLYILKGNHDWDGLPALGLFRPSDLTVIDTPSVITIGATDILAVPYMRKIHMNGKSYADILEELGKQSQNKRIAVVHAALEGTLVGESEDVVPVDALKKCGADFGILGHIHKHNRPADGWYYTGSLIRCTFGEEGERSGVYYYDGNVLEDIELKARAVFNLRYKDSNEAKEKMKEDIHNMLETHPNAVFKINVPGGSSASDVIEDAGEEAQKKLGVNTPVIVKYDYTVNTENKLKEIKEITETDFGVKTNEPLITSMREQLSVDNLWGEYCKNYAGVDENSKQVAALLGLFILHDDIGAETLWTFLKSDLGKAKNIIQRLEEKKEAVKLEAENKVEEVKGKPEKESAETIAEPIDIDDVEFEFAMEADLF